MYFSKKHVGRTARCLACSLCLRDRTKLKASGRKNQVLRDLAQGEGDNPSHEDRHLHFGVFPVRAQGWNNHQKNFQKLEDMAVHRSNLLDVEEVRKGRTVQILPMDFGSDGYTKSQANPEYRKHGPHRYLAPPGPSIAPGRAVSE